MNTGRSPTSGVYRQPRPEPCDEYPNIHRHWDSSHGVFAARVLPGQYYVTDRPDEMISTLLGSCIAACIRDPAVRVGGLNHFMLPDGEGDLDGLASRYGVHAMEHLINDILKRGGRRDRLEIKLFGGGRILSGLSDVGEKNIRFVREFIRVEGYGITAEDLGGEFSRKIHYFPATGRVLVKRLPASRANEVVQEEVCYERSIRKTAVSDDIELFD